MRTRERLVGASIGVMTLYSQSVFADPILDFLGSTKGSDAYDWFFGIPTTIGVIVVIYFLFKK